MTFEVKVDKQKAIFLKKMGWDYQTISEFLGCSYAWCALNLRDVQRDRELMKSYSYLLLQQQNEVENE